MYYYSSSQFGDLGIVLMLYFLHHYSITNILLKPLFVSLLIRHFNIQIGNTVSMRFVVEATGKQRSAVVIHHDRFMSQGKSKGLRILRASAGALVNC